MNRQATAPSPTKLPVSLAANPKLSSWLKFSDTGQVTVSPGKVEIGQGIVTALAQIAADGRPVTIDLLEQRVSLGEDRSWPFQIGAEAKAMLLEGLDVIELTLKHKAQIAAFQAADRKMRPWIYLGDANR